MAACPFGGPEFQSTRLTKEERGAMDLKLLSSLVLVAGCNADEVQPPDLPEPTEGGYGDTGDSDTQGTNPSECWSHDAPVGAVRWQCEGLAEASIFFTLDVEIPDWLEGAEDLQRLLDYGRVDGAHLFGPWSGEAYDDPGVDACCSPNIASDDEAGLDETGAGTDDETIPQAAHACSDDCADQACRTIPTTLRQLADEIPAGIPVLGLSYRQQLDNLANWVATNHQGCWDAMIADGVRVRDGFYYISGDWTIPADDR